MHTIGHITAHRTMKPGNIVQLAPGGVEWKVTHVRADGCYEVVSPRGRRRVIAPHKAVTVNGSRVVPEADWKRSTAISSK